MAAIIATLSAGGAALAPAARDRLLHQLEVDGHRVQRVLDLVRDAGRQAAERRELVRVPERRLHFTQVAEVAAHQHHADDGTRRVAHGVGHDQPGAAPGRARLFPGSRGLVLHLQRPARLSVGAGLLHQHAAGMIGRPQLRERLTARWARQLAQHRGIGEQQLAGGREKRDRVLEAADDRLERRLLARQPRAVRREPVADGVEEPAEFAQFILAREVQFHAELAAPQPRQPAFDEVDRPQERVGEQHGQQAGGHQRGQGGDHRGPQRPVEIGAGEIQIHADANRPEACVAREQRLLDLERPAFVGVDGPQLLPGAGVNQRVEARARGQPRAGEPRVAVRDDHVGGVHDGGVGEVGGIRPGLENRSQAGVRAQGGVRVGARRGHFAGAMVNRVRQEAAP